MIFDSFGAFMQVRRRRLRIEIDTCELRLEHGAESPNACAPTDGRRSLVHLHSDPTASDEADPRDTPPKETP